MGILRNILAAPLSWIYGGIVAFRHILFDWKILKSEEFEIPIICVGNITVGGTGKTPHTEYLIQILKDHYNVAVLSRGYKRRTKGFVLATTSSSFKRIGDESKQIKLKFPEIPVAVCEKRVEGIRKLREIHPEVNLIILDDAFQHRYVEPWVNIVLMDYNYPIYNDYMLPLGRLRDSKSQLCRAQIVIATKCPEDLRPLDLRMIHKNLDLYPYQSLYFTNFISGCPVPLFAQYANPEIEIGANTPVIAMVGIANPRYFLEHIERNFTLLDKIIYPDHYTFKMRDIHRLDEQLATSPADTIVMLTEKDAVKLLNSKKIPENIMRKLYYIPINVQFMDGKQDEFINQLDQYVKKNQKYDILHPA